MSAPKMVTLKIEGMDCASCANTITKTILKAGPRDVHVDFVTGEAVFEEVPPALMDQIVAAIHSVGYRVVKQAGHHHTAHAAPSSFLQWYLWISALCTAPLLLHMFWDQELLMNPWFQLLMSIPVMFIGLMHFGRSAWGSVKALAPNMDVLIFIGSFSAFFYSIYGTFFIHQGHHAHDYLFFETGATIITLVLLGNLIEQRSVRMTTSALEGLYKLQEAPAQKIISTSGAESIVSIPSMELRPGDVCQVNTGDTIPADGMVQSGDGIADESMITGESKPVTKNSGMNVFKGTLLTQGNVRIRVDAVPEETVLGKIIQMVKDATRSKPELQQIGDKVASIFVPIVLVIAVITFLVWKFVMHAGYSESLMPALAVLVISCPCAMGLATPTAVMVGLGRAARAGILIRGGRTMEALANVKEILFDKTGTLTTGTLRITESKAHGSADPADCLSIIYQLELFSSHPIARSLVSELKDGVKPVLLHSIRENKGFGMEGVNEKGDRIQFGSKRILKAPPEGDLFLTVNDQLVFSIRLGDAWRPEAKEALNVLREQGLKTTLVSGDRNEKCEKAREFGISEIHAEKLPEEKLKLLEEKKKHHAVAMVGDGINDAPALAAADVGISLGSGTQIAIRSAQVILTGEGNMNKLADAYLISKHTLITIRQNLFWAFAYNVVAIPLAAMGFLSPMIGALSMAFSDVIVVGNSLRLRYKKIRS